MVTQTELHTKIKSIKYFYFKHLLGYRYICIYISIENRTFRMFFEFFGAHLLLQLTRAHFKRILVTYQLPSRVIRAHLIRYSYDNNIGLFVYIIVYNK